MSFPYGLVQAGQNLGFFLGECHLDNTLLPGLVHVASPHFLFRETGRASARNTVGGVPAWCGKYSRSFPSLEFSAPVLCREELCIAAGGGSSELWQAVGGSRSAGLGGRQPERHPGDSITGPATLADHVSSQKLSFLTCKMGIKVASTPG